MEQQNESNLPLAIRRVPAKKKRVFWKILSSVAALYLLLDCCGKARFVTKSYEVYDARIRDPLRIAILCDLHGALYGENQSALVDALAQANPAAVLLLGDLFHEFGNNPNAYTLLKALSGRFSCYFIPGNHEYKSGEMAEIRAALEEAGITILAGSSVLLSSGETQVQLFGIDDGLNGKPEQLQQIKNAADTRDPAVYSILAIHVPNDVESYLPYGFDLMLSGHTHGGQIRLPGILNGLYAPGQGFFPKYGGGRYDWLNQSLIISRGLARRPYWLPRIFNPPELTFVTLLPVSE